MASSCSCGSGKKTVQLQNPHIKDLVEDHIYHFALNTNMELKKMFGDIKFVCTGGASKRMKGFAEFIADEIGYKQPPGTTLQNISEPADRYCMYKVGPVLSVSHGIGCPSMGVCTNELIKLMYYAKCKDPVFFRIGTCGGLGMPAGSVVVSEDCCDGMGNKSYTLPVLGKCVERPAILDPQLVIDLKSVSYSCDDFKTVSGTTMCAEDFYEGQARMDGPFCNYTETEKLRFLESLQHKGVANIEMEATCFAALTRAAGIRAGIVCVTLVNRLEGDQISTPKDVMIEWQKRPQIIVARYIKKCLGIC